MFDFSCYCCLVLWGVFMFIFVLIETNIEEEVVAVSAVGNEQKKNTYLQLNKVNRIHITRARA